MPSFKPPFPVPGTFIQAIRDSADNLTKAARVEISDEAIKHLLLSPAFVESFQRVSLSHGLAFPLNFPSVLAELNFLSILCLLNFASGYRVPLHEQTGRGAWDSIRALAFGLFLSSSIEGDLLSAHGLCTLTEQKIAGLLNVNIHVERPHDTIPGVTVGQLGGPVYELVQLITQTLTETGKILIEAGYQDLGSFVLESLKEGVRVGKTVADPDVVLERIVRAIPAFQDMSIVNGEPIYCLKKAVFLIHAIKIRFGGGEKPTIPVCPTENLPVFSDNVLPSLLVYLGVINLDHADMGLSSLFSSTDVIRPSLLKAPLPASSKERSVPVDGPILDEAQAYVLRAASIAACERIVTVARNLHQSSAETTAATVPDWLRSITLPQLDMWLWAIAKDRVDYRQLGRFVLRDTVYF